MVEDNPKMIELEEMKGMMVKLHYNSTEVKPSNKWLSTFGSYYFGQSRPKVNVGGYLATDGITTSGIPVKM